MWPGRRYWFWSLGLGELVGFSLVAAAFISGDARGLDYGLFVIAVYWLMATITGAFIVLATRLLWAGMKRARRSAKPS